MDNCEHLYNGGVFQPSNESFDMRCLKCGEHMSHKDDLIIQLKLIEELKYIGGIVRKGEGRDLNPEESVQDAILGYVKKLEQQLEKEKSKSEALDQMYKKSQQELNWALDALNKVRKIIDRND